MIASAAFRIAVLTAIGAVAAGAAVAAGGSHVTAPKAPAVAAGPLPSRYAARAPTSCLAVRTQTLFDAQLAHLVAPVTMTRLAHPLRAEPALGAARRDFPLPARYASVFDTFGAPRAGVSWHHGDDLFAPRGTPVLAVAGGVVFSVGWQRLGGRRLWLIDEAGNQYYYAHLERYSPLAVDGRRVEAGEILGYVGTTGDAEGTPSHLHFEIHPASLLHLGYDGAVDPTSYLRAWAKVDPRTPAAAPRCLARAS